MSEDLNSQIPLCVIQPPLPRMKAKTVQDFQGPISKFMRVFSVGVEVA